ncbi:unnamed protein product [Cylindrotheca closterium]|uniref:Uncharacterized protein n=1 Tax=Cylindrotheca closterium TaxID=2856 RepID=A0AAD2FNR7_9STRA|nr:unnamed protein product [Cylindrotheca closterium]
MHGQKRCRISTTNCNQHFAYIQHLAKNPKGILEQVPVSSEDIVEAVATLTGTKPQLPNITSLNMTNWMLNMMAKLAHFFNCCCLASLILVFRRGTHVARQETTYFICNSHPNPKQNGGTWEKSNERYNMDTQECSHKFNHGAVKYEVAMSLLEPQCAWISGPHKGGKHDLTIFQEGGLKQKLKRWKQAIVDRGYTTSKEDEKYILCIPRETDSVTLNEYKGRARL